MKKLKIILAAVLIASIFTVSGTNSIWADNLFSGFFKSTEKERSNSANSGDLIVVLDAGHGGRDSGAVGNGLYEKSLTLKIAQYCKAELEKYKGVKVYLTRANDTFVDLSKRVSKASAVKADVFVSIHLNSFSDSQYHGAQTFYTKESLSSKKLAISLQTAFCQILEPENEREALLKTEDIIITKNCKVTTAIVECGFLSNQEEEKKLADETYQSKIAESIKAGIDNYFTVIEPKSE